MAKGVIIKFNREEAFPKKVAQEKMADEMTMFQNMVIGINRAFPDREERMAYMKALIEGLAVEEDEDGTGSVSEDEGHEGENGQGSENERGLCDTEASGDSGGVDGNL